MKFSEDTKVAKYMIEAYSDDSISVRGETYQGCLIVCPNQAPITWEVADPEHLQAIELAPLLRLEPEVLLIGQGRSFKAADTELVATLIQAQVGYEFMTVKAACRSYNLLANDYRRVVLGLIR